MTKTVLLSLSASRRRTNFACSATPPSTGRVAAGGCGGGRWLRDAGVPVSVPGHGGELDARNRICRTEVKKKTHRFITEVVT